MFFQSPKERADTAEVPPRVEIEVIEDPGVKIDVIEESTPVKGFDLDSAIAEAVEKQSPTTLVGIIKALVALKAQRASLFAKIKELKEEQAALSTELKMRKKEHILVKLKKL